MDRPSSRSTDSVSSVTWTAITLGGASVKTESVPFIAQSLQVLINEAFDLAKLTSTKTKVVSQSYFWIKPELGALIVSIYMRMPRLCTVLRPEIKAIRADKQCRGHALTPLGEEKLKAPDPRYPLHSSPAPLGSLDRWIRSGLSGR